MKDYKKMWENLEDELLKRKEDLGRFVFNTQEGTHMRAIFEALRDEVEYWCMCMKVDAEKNETEAE